MLELFVPDKYYKSIYKIDYKKLKKDGIKCIIFDLNNTLAPLTEKYPSKKLTDLFLELIDMKYKIYIISNSSKRRVEPFKEHLCVDASYNSLKPFLHKFKRVYKINNFKDNEIAVIGDEIFTDIYASNRMNFLSILVNPMGTKEYVSTKIGRVFESIIIDKLEKKNLFKKGEYYE